MNVESFAGFASPVISAQATFRAVMNALARPGSVQAIEGVPHAPSALSPISAAIALTLFDQDTPVWLHEKLAASPDVFNWLRFHTGAPTTANGLQAAFALVGSALDMPPFESFSLGSAEYPDHATTVLLEVKSHQAGVPMIFTGPGIKERIVIKSGPLPGDFRANLLANRALFPRGLDLLLIAPEGVVALPRSIILAEAA